MQRHLDNLLSPRVIVYTMPIPRAALHPQRGPLLGYGRHLRATKAIVGEQPHRREGGERTVGMREQS